MIGGLAALAVQNSCQKDIPDHPPDGREGLTPDILSSRNLKSIFLEAVATEKLGKMFYLVERVRKNVRTNHVFLEECYRSAYCDEMYVYGFIREIKPSSVPMLTGKSRSEIIAYNDKTYEIATYSRTRIIKLPCDQQPVRKINPRYSLVMTSANVKIANFKRQWQ